MLRLFRTAGVMSVAALCLYAPARAQSPLPEILPEACETSLALSAAPEYLRAGAGLLILTKTGYQTARTTSNNFTCIVNRDDPRVLKPTCFDAEGTETIIPKIVTFARCMLDGQSVEEINETLKAEFDEEVLVSPRRPGVAYMLSRYNRPVNPRTGELGFFPPHVMFYAPNLTNDDIGHDMAHHNPARPLPMIAYGGPQGYMLMISDDGTERQRSDLDPSCPDWIWE
ncbi:MAG: hypothetical protein R3C60_01930 [Parvularculaceae bacterium]